jgi:hypothetical protein
MPKCPQCGKPLREFSRRCPSCQADLDLLVDYVSSLQTGLDQAEQLTRSGELGKAFWAYLEVLEVDPDNLAARQQIGQVVTAVRQFDRIAPGRRWLHGSDQASPVQAWLLLALAGVLIVLAFTVGYILGYYAPTAVTPPTDQPAVPKKLDPLDKLPNHDRLGS